MHQDPFPKSSPSESRSSDITPKTINTAAESNSDSQGDTGVDTYKSSEKLFCGQTYPSFLKSSIQYFTLTETFNLDYTEDSTASQYFIPAFANNASDGSDAVPAMTCYMLSSVDKNTGTTIDSEFNPVCFIDGNIYNPTENDGFRANCFTTYGLSEGTDRFFACFLYNATGGEIVKDMQDRHTDIVNAMNDGALHMIGDIAFMCVGNRALFIYETLNDTSDKFGENKSNQDSASSQERATEIDNNNGDSFDLAYYIGKPLEELDKKISSGNSGSVERARSLGLNVYDFGTVQVSNGDMSFGTVELYAGEITDIDLLNNDTDCTILGLRVGQSIDEASRTLEEKYGAKQYHTGDTSDTKKTYYYYEGDEVRMVHLGKDNTQPDGNNIIDSIKIFMDTTGLFKGTEIDLGDNPFAYEDEEALEVLETGRWE